eukprot:944471-Rhodomonas_salina.1
MRSQYHNSHGAQKSNGSVFGRLAPGAAYGSLDQYWASDAVRGASTGSLIQYDGSVLLRWVSTRHSRQSRGTYQLLRMLQSARTYLVAAQQKLSTGKGETSSVKKTPLSFHVVRAHK